MNGEIVESGYCQLNDVSINNEIKAYNITLYGGLGDFFYKLKYNDDGTTKTLADLRYFIKDENGHLLDKDNEMSFTINKEFVDKCYSQDWSTNGSKLTDTITFIPANNGAYEKFDSNHCLINVNGDAVFPKSRTDTSDPNNPVTYTTKNGYGYASLEKDYTEWEMRDLRSYQQRPAIKVSKLIEAICNEENSGYQVTLDTAFFNDNNPYWSKSFIALPLLGTTSEDSSSKTSGTSSSNNTTIGNISESQRILSNATMVAVTAPNISTNASGVVDMSAYPVAATFNLDVDFSLSTSPLQTTSSDNLFITSRRVYTVGRNTYYRDYYQSISAQVIAYDADTNDVLGFSDLYYFGNTIGGRGSTGLASSPDTWIDYTARNDATAVPVKGNFKKQSNGQYYFIANNGDNTFKLSLNKVPRADKVRIVLYVDWHRDDTRCEYRLYDSSTTVTDASERGIIARQSIETVDNQSFEIVTNNPILSGATVTKEMFLKTENSPADFLLSYSKLFGLYFVKDVIDKKITIYSRMNYFNSTIHNWDDRIDKSKNITITPILFDKKWYLMSLETPDTYFASKYKSKYNMTYGQKRLNTGYNFNSETTKLYDDNIYQNVVTAVDSDKYFRSFYTAANKPVPCFVNDNLTYTLYNGEDGLDIDIYGVHTIDTGKTKE